MHVFLNGDFVPEEQAVIPVSDRGFLLGDGLFETVPFYNGNPFRWDPHLQRLQQGLDVLRIKIPFAPKQLLGFARQLLELNKTAEVLLRLTISRGSSARGYSIKLAQNPVVVMTLHALPSPRKPEAWRLVTSTLRVLADDPIMNLKTGSRVRNVLARAEAEDRGADEALLLNQRGEITEGVATNFFCAQKGVLCTSPITAGLLPGVTRAAILEICRALKIQTAERPMTPAEVRASEGAFLSVSTMGIVEAISLDGTELRRTPLVAELRQAYWELVERETRRD
jgi:branched-chain amino acid aminotransferase